MPIHHISIQAPQPSYAPLKLAHMHPKAAVGWSQESHLGLLVPRFPIPLERTL